MEPRRWRVPAPLAGGDGEVWVYGHWGRPVLVFPSQQGSPWDFAERGMLDGVAHLVEAGRVKLYCVASFDSRSWFAGGLGLEERAQRHGAYAEWLYDHVVPRIRDDCGGRGDLAAVGVSFGAYHAAHVALQRADLFPLGLCFSGVYDLERIGAWGDAGDATYFANPAAYVAGTHGEHLEWLRRTATLVLVCGQGQWEDTTGALESTRDFGRLLAGKGLRAEVDLWGPQWPHDWPSWRAQLAHHLPRFC